MDDVWVCEVGIGYKEGIMKRNWDVIGVIGGGYVCVVALTNPSYHGSYVTIGMSF